MKDLWDIFTDYFGTTPIHPQFIMKKINHEAIDEAKKYGKNKNLIDLGCGRMPYKEELSGIIKSYYSVDHPSVSKLYNPPKKPDLLADITKPLSLPRNNFDIALLLEVIEYLDDPPAALNEIRKILKPYGLLILSSPFLYPLHDVPYDKNRFSETALRTLLKKSGFKVIKLKSQGNFVSFWFLSLNVFLLRRILDILKGYKSLSSLVYLLFLVLITFPIYLNLNFLYLLINPLIHLLPNYPNYFPLNYLVIAKKTN